MFPSIYDIFLAPVERLGLRRWRAQVVSPATGRVLEVGAGTGLNLPHYRQASHIVLTDPNPDMLRRARDRLRSACCPVHLAVADAQILPFPAETFDIVIATLTFCTIPQPEKAFAEIRRVLRPGGTLRLLEHVRTSRPSVAHLQDALTPAWKRVAHGCHLNRCPLESARAQGFEADQVHRGLDGWLLAATLHMTAPKGEDPA